MLKRRGSVLLVQNVEGFARVRSDSCWLGGECFDCAWEGSVSVSGFYGFLLTSYASSVMIPNWQPLHYVAFTSTGCTKGEVFITLSLTYELETLY